MSINLRITGKNSDGEYWLHIVGGGQNAGFNLGDPATMVGAALLKAVSGQRFISAGSPPCAPAADPVRDALVEALDFANLLSTRTGYGMNPSTDLQRMARHLVEKLETALALAKGETK